MKKLKMKLAKEYTQTVFDVNASVYDFTPEMILKAYIAGWDAKENSVKPTQAEIEADIVTWERP